MRTGFGSFVVIAFVLGCGGGGDSTPDARGSYDAANRIDRYYVAIEVGLPRTPEQVNATKYEFPGSGIPVNKLGAMFQVMLDMMDPLPIQDELDANMLNGEALQVGMFRTVGLGATDHGATAMYVHVVDADDPVDPSNNWAGDGTFRLDAGQTLDETYTANLEGGEILAVGTSERIGTMTLPFFAGEEPVMSHGVHSVLSGTLTEDEFDGFIASAATPQQFIDNVVPSGARLLTRAIEANVPKKEDIKNFFDKDDNDVITEAELAESATFATLSQPDVDLDGDSIYDHVSQAVLLRMVRCQPLEE